MSRQPACWHQAEPAQDTPVSGSTYVFGTGESITTLEPHWYDVPLPSNHWAFNPDTPKAEFNLDRAKELFDAAGGGPDTTITFQAISTANPEWVVVGEILQQSLQEIGIPVEIEQ